MQHNRHSHVFFDQEVQNFPPRHESFVNVLGFSLILLLVIGYFAAVTHAFMMLILAALSGHDLVRPFILFLASYFVGPVYFLFVMGAPKSTHNKNKPGFL